MPTIRTESAPNCIEVVHEEWPGPDAARAILMSGAQYGVLRQVQLQLPEDIESEIFTDEAAARKWCGHL